VQNCIECYDRHTVPGLRERKKQRTRETIVREAMALFHQRGFDKTTVADIAEAADIAPRTFFAYFETKEAVVFHDAGEVRRRFAERVRRRPEGESTFDALRAWVADWLDVLGSQHEARHDLVRSTPSLQVREREHRAEFEQLIAESIADELGLPADSLRPRLVAAAAVAALAALADDEAHAPAQALALVEEALTFLEGGLDALRARPAV
jgi:AcrR family transcriptional regulator